MPDLKSYSKWFRFLMGIFWPMAVVSLISFGTSIFAYVASVLDALYTMLLLFTFIIESILRSRKSSNKSK